MLRTLWATVRQGKIENRSNRCSLGFLISWNGSKDTVTKEMLRGSREHTLVVPMTGKDIRAAVRDGTFSEVLTLCWQKAITTSFLLMVASVGA